MSTDSALVTAVLAGVAEAEQALYDRHVDRLFAMAFHFTGDRDAAADLVQETFIMAFDRLQQFRGDAQLSTWLGRILVSRALTERRRAQPPALNIEHAERIPARESFLDAFDTRAHIYAAVKRLTPKLRAVVILFDIEGYTHEEVAHMLDIPVGTSKARLSEARSQLRALLSSVHST